MINLTFEQITNSRNKHGFVDLDALFANAQSEREIRGNANRDKRWFKISDGTAMFKSNADEQVYSHYSELICTELAKQAGLEAAQYDIARYNGQIGVITKNVCKPGEELLTINELIGDGPTYAHCPDNTDIDFVFNGLQNKLLADGYEPAVIDACMLQLRKQMLFDLYIMETDRHTENLSFIASKNDNTGTPSIRLAPMYDTESALTLPVCSDKSYMKDIYTSKTAVKLTTDMQEPKISVILEDDEELPQDNEHKSMLDVIRGQVGSCYETPSEEMWKSTLDFLVEDERALQFAEGVLSGLNIDKAIQVIESTKQCEIPEEVKNMTRECFNYRKREIFFELGLDLEQQNITPKELT